MGAKPLTPLSERFWPKVDKRGPEECWPWKAHLDDKGYGRIRLGGGRGRHIGANRASWMVNKGPIPDGLFVCHRCDNPICVNPAHLFLGSAADNTHDMISKGRGGKQKLTHCVRGHEFNAENTRRSSANPNHRSCRACDRESALRRYHRLRGNSPFNPLTQEHRSAIRAGLQLHYAITARGEHND